MVAQMARRRSPSAAHQPADRQLCPVPPGAPSWVTPELVGQIIKVWQPYYAEPLTAEEALAIIMNVAGLWDVLAGGVDQ